MTYRLGDHTTADDATRYRNESEVVRERKLEPIARLRAYLIGAGAWNGELEEKLQRECAERVQQAVEEYLAVPPPPPSAMFDHLYAELPTSMRDQLEAATLLANADKAGDG